MIRYPLERVGSLLVTKAAVSGSAGVKVVRLLLDTGSVHTILPVEVLESIGCSPAASMEHVRLITGSGYLIAPRVRLLWFQCIGQKEKRHDCRRSHLALWQLGIVLPIKVSFL